MEDCVPDIIVPGGDILEGVAKLSELEELDEEFLGGRLQCLSELKLLLLPPCVVCKSVPR